jgi:SanA protein
MAHIPAEPTRRLGARALARTAGILAIVGVLWMTAASLWVITTSRGRTYSDPTAIPARRVGLVLGCSRFLRDGRRNSFFDKRIQAAALLIRAGKVRYLVVSGDNHLSGYDEPTDMKNSLVQAGVPAERVYCDYAGFRTVDSIVRAREIFGQTQITVISQEFHNERAIFIAQHRGIDAIAFNAGEADAYDSFKIKCRELVARANMLLDIFVFHRQPKFLGEKVSIPI